MNYVAVTLYHKCYDPDTRLDTWQRSTFPKALWHATVSAKAMQGIRGLVNDSVYTVRIFMQDALVISPEDVLVCGICLAETPKELSADIQSFRVTVITDARRGSPHMQHWKVVGT